MAKMKKVAAGSADAKDTTTAADIARDTMAGDLRDCILDILRTDKSPLPWNAQPEERQRETVQKVTDAVRHAVHRAVDIIAAEGRAVMVGELVKVQIKDGIQAQVNFSKSDPLRHELADSQGQSVLLVVSSADRFEGDRGPVPIVPDQTSLIDDGDDDLPVADRAPNIPKS